MADIREWLGEIVCFLCLMTVLLHILPDTGLKKYVRFFLGILFLLVVMEPVGTWLGKEAFLERLREESLSQIQDEMEQERKGLEEVLPEWDEEAYQRRLQEKVKEMWDEEER